MQTVGSLGTGLGSQRKASNQAGTSGQTSCVQFLEKKTKVHVFIHSFMTEYLLCAGHYSRHWGCKKEQSIPITFWW